MCYLLLGTSTGEKCLRMCIKGQGIYTISHNPQKFSREMFHKFAKVFTCERFQLYECACLVSV